MNIKMTVHVLIDYAKIITLTNLRKYFQNIIGLVLSPRSGIELGGTEIFIAGPCYTPDNQIVCRFNKTIEAVAVYVSPELAYCVTPPLYVVGRIPVELSLDGGATFNFNGTFRSSELKF